MKRDATQSIWRAVVFAGAMLGAPACSKSKPAPTTPAPSNTASPNEQARGAQMAPMGKPSKGGTADPCAGDANPCGGAPTPNPQ